MEGCDDYIDACSITGIAHKMGGIRFEDKDDLRQTCLEMIRHVLREGLMEIGELGTREEGFLVWDLPLEQTMERVERDWKALGRNPTLWEVCWLRNTAQGNELGEALHRRGQSGA